MTLADSLSNYIESLSSDFLLADPQSHEDIDHLSSLFAGLDQDPWKTGFPEISEHSLKAVQLLHQIKTEPPEIKLRLFDALGDLISDIQNTLRKNILSDTPLSDAISEKKESRPDLSCSEDAINDGPKPPLKKALETGGLRHPGALPDHLDNEVFAEFLSAQPEVIQKMEALILSLEESFSEKNMNELKRLIHTAKGEAGFLNLADVETLLHQAEEYIEQGYIKESTDVLLAMVDWLKRACEVYSGGRDMPIPIEPVLNRLKKNNLTEPLQPGKAIFPLDTISDETDIPAETTPLPLNMNRRYGDLKESISVDADRLDRMVSMIGELVIVESMLSQADEIRGINSPKLFKTIAAMTKIIRELQAMGLSLRMVPIRSVFQKMGRIARDVAKKAAKPIRFVMSGEETELDKTIVDKLNDPLMHLIRNAIDHGIEETAQERIQQKKPAAATITLRAFHQGGNVHVEVQDDGVGLNPEKILSRAIEMNLVSKSDSLSDPDIFQLIFEPGFSTAKEVTEISGRGVGMNIVRQRIESLRGTIHIRTKALQGTTFSMVIPLTLAIIDGLIVRSGETRFVIPTLSIRTTLFIEGETIRSALGKEEMILFNKKMIPLFRLSTLIGHPHTPAGNEKVFVVIVETGERETAIVVDGLIGKQQIVIKSLGELVKNTPFVSGGAILNDGQVGLILDIQGLVKTACKKI